RGRGRGRERRRGRARAEIRLLTSGAIGFFSRLQTFLNSLAGRGGQGLWRQGMFVFIVLLRGCAQKSNLSAIPPAPLAEQQINSQTQTLTKHKRTIKRVKLQTRSFPTDDRKIAHAV